MRNVAGEAVLVAHLSSFMNRFLSRSSSLALTDERIFR